MAIFGRSKKNKATTSPQPQSSTNFYQPFNGQAQHGNAPTWGSVEQRPNTSHSFNQPQTQSWMIAPVPPQYQPGLVQQSYLVAAPPLPRRPYQNGGNNSTLKLSSGFDPLANESHQSGAQLQENEIAPHYLQMTQYLSQSTGLCDLISSKLNTVITLIDGEKFSGDERELIVFAPPAPMLQQQQETGIRERGFGSGKSKGMVNNSVSTALTSTNYFAKVHLYANSRLPPNFPPMKLYMSTFPLLGLAAKYSEHVYMKPAGQEKETHVDSGWSLGIGTKAMVIKSVPMDDMNTIVFAIRGTQSFMDWAVNLKSAPTSPEGFLDDPGNLCHAGFLKVARNMIEPVAARLRFLLEEDPSRSNCSLLITGHSAGGAVAALLYSHMLSTSREAESKLTVLTGFFKRVHCITFGAPPVSLLPLSKPNTPELRKSLFLSFVNEGDPVPRADKAYVRSLIDLYSSPAPGQSCIETLTPPKLHPIVHSLGKSSSSLALRPIRPLPLKTSKTAPLATTVPLWPVPEATLSNAGRIVLLRSVQRYESRVNKNKKESHELMDQGVVAQMISDEVLRGVVWGDPVCHMMKLYARRIEVLATNAVMGRS